MKEPSKTDNYSKCDDDNVVCVPLNDVELKLQVPTDKYNTDGQERKNTSLLQQKLQNVKLKVYIFVQRLFYVVSIVGTTVYLGFSITFDPPRSIFLCILYPLIIFYFLSKLTHGRINSYAWNVWKKMKEKFVLTKRTRNIIRRGSTLVCVVGLTVFLIIDIWDNSDKWVPLSGLVIFLILLFVTSESPLQVDWIPVVWGLLLQFGLGILILRWRAGYLACKWVGDQVTILLEYTDTGSKFVFGENYMLHPVAFKILPVVVFFSSIVHVLYYLGVMQVLIKANAICLQFFMQTTPIESFATAAHIFIGQVESCVALKPFLSRLTRSELNSVMTSGFATVAGTVIAAYVEFGVPAEHVISASFMSAPAALAVSKLSLPETEIPKIKSQKEIKITAGREVNILEAVSVGAADAIKLVAYVVVNLIAFLAFLTLLDSFMSYLGGRVGYPKLSFQMTFSYLFTPLSRVMGVAWEDCNFVASLIGKKLVLNEFLSFADLGQKIRDGGIADRSAVIATYILCGFGSMAAIGINFGSLTSACPSRRGDIATGIIRAFVGGNVACFMTACIAGLLYQDSQIMDSTIINTTALLNTTTIRNPTSAMWNTT
ncbi:hypothetical protein ACJMK2_012607 [Sinanodonta woodiana]|uniref:Sodium/nucleoside cotransporter n=1 Tax=Sinanodonta woodiana TaxID=1069815 RepID=A0ABD3VAP7_SINWO